MLIEFNNTSVTSDHGKNSFGEELEAKKRWLYIYVWREMSQRVAWKSYSIFPSFGHMVGFYFLTPFEVRAMWLGIANEM